MTKKVPKSKKPTKAWKRLKTIKVSKNKDSLFLIDEALKRQQWELAKGHLMALVALQGSYQTSSESFKGYNELEKKVETFIGVIEDNGLHA